MSSVASFCFIAGFLVCTDAVAVTHQADEAAVMVGSDAKQIMRNVNLQPEAPSYQPESKADSDPANTTVKPLKSININLYYETRCPDCVQFINETLAVMWENTDLRPHLNITMNPYGNAMSLPLANVSEGYKFWHADKTGQGWDWVHICQHGNDECLGNTIQACAISMVEQEKYMDLITCMAGKPDWGIEKASYECMTAANIDHQRIQACAMSPVGNKLMADLGKQTEAVQGRLGTPWVLVDGTNLNNVTDLMRTVCTHVGDDGPASCSPFKSTNPAEQPKNDKPAQEGGDGDFTVLQALKKNEFALLSSKNI